MRKILLSSLLLLSTLLPSSAVCSDYTVPVYKGRYVKHLDTEQTYGNLVMFDGHIVNVTISYESSQADFLERRYPSSLIERSLVTSNRLTLQLLEEQGISPEVCKRVYEVHIFILSPETMYDSDLLDELKRRRGLGAVYALLDTTLEIDGHNNFLFSDRGDFENHKSLQHEFAHYWHEKYCLKTIYPDSEHYADMMERRSERIYR